MKSIKTKILVVVISGLLVITAVVSAIAVNMTHEIMHRDADRILNNVTQKEAAYINDALGDIKKSATIMEHYAKSEIAELSQLEDPEFLENYIQKTKRMFGEIALNTNGIEGYYFRLNPEYTTPTTGYYNILNDDGTTREMKVTDLSKYPENDVKNVGWYYTSIKAGKGQWLDPYYFPGYDIQLISYTIPLYVGSDLLGVIGFDMDFSYLVSRIDEISVYEKGHAALISKDGEINYNEIEEDDSKDPHTSASVELLNGMKLELSAEYKDIQREIHPMLSKIVFAFVIVLLCSIVYTVFVTERIVRPLRKLTKAAKKISSGVADASNYEQIPIDSKDEIGILARALSGAYEKIQEYTTYINALAYRDSLTGIKNTTAYAEATAEVNSRINHDNPKFGVLVADINNLKLTNDKYGHDVGNQLIIHTSKLLTDTFETSSIFRIGGDEFAVILKDSDYRNYKSLLVQFDEACKEDYITVFEDRIPISIARGVALFNPEVDRIYEDVFANADHAMYLNKNESKMAMA